MITINIRYPELEHFHVYTDGSCFDDLETAGSGVFSNIFSFQALAGKYKTAFDREVEAIQITLGQLLAYENSFNKVVLLSDFQNTA